MCAQENAFFPPPNVFNIITAVLRKCHITVGVTVMFFRNNAFIMASETSTHWAQQHVMLNKCVPFPFEVQAILQQHQNTTFLNTNTGRLQLFDLSARLWQHGTLLIMQDVPPPPLNMPRSDHPINAEVKSTTAFVVGMGGFVF